MPPTPARTCAPKTLLALRGDRGVFEASCRRKSESALPASVKTVLRFIAEQRPLKSPSTVVRYLYSIGVIHRQAGCIDPTTDPRVRARMATVARRARVTQRQVAPITFERRNRLLAAAGRQGIDARNRALLAVAYDTGRRPALLVGARAEDFRYDAGIEEHALRLGKDSAFLAPGTAALLSEWLAVSGIETGPIFRAVSRGMAPHALSARDVGRLFKAMAAAAALPASVVDAITGDSARIGMALDMEKVGLDLRATEEAGGWRSLSAVRRCVDRGGSRKWGGAAMLAALQNRL